MGKPIDLDAIHDGIIEEILEKSRRELIEELRSTVKYRRQNDTEYVERVCLFRKIVPELREAGFEVTTSEYGRPLNSLYINLGHAVDRKNPKAARQRIEEAKVTLARIFQSRLTLYGTHLEDAKKGEVEITLMVAKVENVRITYRDRLPKEGADGGARCRIVRKKRPASVEYVVECQVPQAHAS
jgi:hypothetical protein